MNDVETFGLLLFAWRVLGEHDPVWDRYGLHVLTAADLLNIEPESMAGQVPLRFDVIVLIEALAARLDLVVADISRPAAVRLAHDAAAAELRRGIEALR